MEIYYRSLNKLMNMLDYDFGLGRTEPIWEVKELSDYVEAIMNFKNFPLNFENFADLNSDASYFWSHHNTASNPNDQEDFNIEMNNDDQENIIYLSHNIINQRKESINFESESFLTANLAESTKFSSEAAFDSKWGKNTSTDAISSESKKKKSEKDQKAKSKCPNLQKSMDSDEENKNVITKLKLRKKNNYFHLYKFKLIRLK
jgi:hypothetical protein